MPKVEITSELNSLQKSIDQRLEEFKEEKFFGDATPIGQSASEAAKNQPEKIPSLSRH